MKYTDNQISYLQDQISKISKKKTGPYFSENQKKLMIKAKQDEITKINKLKNVKQDSRGFASIVDEFDYDADGERIAGSGYNLLEKVQVDPGCRRQGVARELIEKEIKSLKNNKPIKLIADPQDNSIPMESLVKFYESLGFRVEKNIEGMTGPVMCLGSKKALIKRTNPDK